MIERALVRPEREIKLDSIACLHGSALVAGRDYTDLQPLITQVDEKILQ
jgi:hypothetical protein